MYTAGRSQPETVLPDDLRDIVDTWDHLPNAVKAGIGVCLRAAMSKSGWGLVSSSLRAKALGA